MTAGISIPHRTHRGLAWVAIGLLAGSLGACASAKGRLDGAPPPAAIRSSDGQMIFHVFPYTHAMERNVLGIHLFDNKQMAIGLKVERGDGAPAEVLLRRQDIQLVFEDGTQRYPIDPLKVYEENRIDTSRAAGAFGLVGFTIATARDNQRRANIDSVAIDEWRLSAAVPSANGLLFFDFNGIAKPRGRSLIIEYEDLTTSEVRRVEIAL
ncbi:MAG: hypothetical protein ACRERC_27580 [Candidatus Binatia bacterium]